MVVKIRAILTAGLAAILVASALPSQLEARGSSTTLAKKPSKSTKKKPKPPKKPKKKPKKKPTKATALKATPKRTRHRRLPAASGLTREFHVNEGELPSVVSNARCPVDMASVDNRYCVNRFEGSLIERDKNGVERDWPASEVPEERVFIAVSRANVYPQSSISGAMAKVACENAGKRLCKPIEWRKACGGTHGYTWTYGPTRDPRSCNDQGKSPMLHFYPEVAKSWTLVGMDEMNDPRLNQWEGTLARTGSFESCVNDYGLADMVGNLHEWTSDPNGTFQGGYYLDVQINGDGCMYRTTAHEFTYHDYSTGFRCCKDAEEGDDEQNETSGVATTAAPATPNGASLLDAGVAPLQEVHDGSPSD